MDLSLLDVIDQHATPRRPDDFGITVNEYWEKKNREFSISTAGRLLDDLVDAGILDKREMLHNGRKCSVYAKPDDFLKFSD
jgi:predicted transcriptional regulator